MKLIAIIKSLIVFALILTAISKRRKKSKSTTPNQAVTQFKALLDKKSKDCLQYQKIFKKKFIEEMVPELNGKVPVTCKLDCDKLTSDIFRLYFNVLDNRQKLNPENFVKMITDKAIYLEDCEMKA